MSDPTNSITAAATTADLRTYADIMFYAGRPTRFDADSLEWDDTDYSLLVTRTDTGFEAVMNSGVCEWRTAVSAADFVTDVNDALTDACALGHIANFSRDPER